MLVITMDTYIDIWYTLIVRWKRILLCEVPDMTEEKKSRYTASQKKAAEKYLSEKVEDIRIRVPKGQKAIIKAHAESVGESLNQFVIRAINEQITRDNASR